MVFGGWCGTVGCMGAVPETSDGFDLFWRFAAERQRIYYSRVAGAVPYGLTSDRVLSEFKFTNCFRASDRVSQFLIGEVIYGSGPWGWEDTFARVLLFKLFNRVETWKFVVSQLGEPVSDMVFEPDLREVLDVWSVGNPLYSAAYMMPPPQRFSGRKHHRHLRLLQQMISEDTAGKVAEAGSMGEAFEVLAGFESVGDFLAYQYVTDLNYSEHLTFSETEFVVPGPGALRGLRKCFPNRTGFSSEYLIRWVMERQHEEMGVRGLVWDGLWGRDAQLIDVQNLFCEVDKYSRVAAPHLAKFASGKRIKQKFRPSPEPLSAWFPPKWGLNERVGVVVPVPREPMLPGF